MVRYKKISPYHEILNAYAKSKFSSERWKRCEECGKWIKDTAKTRPIKYCKPCARIVDNEKGKERKKS